MVNKLFRQAMISFSKFDISTK